MKDLNMAKYPEDDRQLRNNHNIRIDWSRGVDGQFYCEIAIGTLHVSVVASRRCMRLASEILRELRTVWSCIPEIEKATLWKYVKGELELEILVRLEIGDGRKRRQIVACDHDAPGTLQFSAEKMRMLDWNNVRYVLAHELAHKLQDSLGLESIGQDTFAYLAPDADGRVQRDRAVGAIMTREEVEAEADEIAARWEFCRSC
jgi:hypothetical protein